MKRPAPKIVVMLAAAMLLALGGATGCRTATGPGVHVTVRAEPKKGYEPPTVGPNGEVFGYSTTVEPGPAAQPEPIEPGFDLIDYRGLGGIVVWAEPAGGSGGAAVETAPNAPGAAAQPPAPVSASVNLDAKNTTNFGHVHVASVGGRVTFVVTAARRRELILRTESGEIMDLPQAFVPDRPGLVEILPAYGEVEEPVALVYVAPAPWVRKVRNGERVTFAPLPPGSYRVTTWHPVLPGASRVVDVKPGPLVKLTLAVGVNTLPKPGR